MGRTVCSPGGRGDRKRKKGGSASDGSPYHGAPPERITLLIISICEAEQEQEFLAVDVNYVEHTDDGSPLEQAVSQLWRDGCTMVEVDDQQEAANASVLAIQQELWHEQSSEDEQEDAPSEDDKEDSVYDTAAEEEDSAKADDVDKTEDSEEDSEGQAAKSDGSDASVEEEERVTTRKVVSSLSSVLRDFSDDAPELTLPRPEYVLPVVYHIYA